jgi:NAD(P)-dependent dehydrogenase (short-subunit alcohol dehydrogenase family)
MRFAGKTAIVTGAGGGLGAAYAAALAREGARVVVADIAAERARETAEAVEAAAREANAAPQGDRSRRAIGLGVDLRRAEEVDAMVREALAAFDRIDILVNNAGGGSSTPGNAASIVDTTPEAWDAMMGVNLSTAFLSIRAVAPLMKARSYGKIVNVASRSARVADPKLQQSPSYATAKTGVLALTRFAARELGPFGITVNCMVPALVLSGPVLEEYWERLGQAAQDEYLAQVALKRLPTVQEVTSVILFLSSDESNYVTGASIDVNGGSFMPA